MSATLDDPQRHAAAVLRLVESYRAIPEGQRVRLAKRTSNLFRPREATTAGLDVSGLDKVISVDPETRTADVQGMCTYETLVAATLAYGLIPLVVPQLKTITLGGAVTGLGIESSSFRNGLPHESVREMDILTGSGEILTVSRFEHSDLFHGFPNSYGSLGYAVRLRIELEPVKPFVGLRHVRFDSVDDLAAAVAQICAKRSYDGSSVEFLDGVMFTPSECYLTLGRYVDWPQDGGLPGPSDYTGQRIYYRSIRQRSHDVLTIADYLWRWDTDWFWCSGAFGAQNPVLRRLWPVRYRRSDFYHRLVSIDHRFGIAARIDRVKGIGPRERVVQDVEIPLTETPRFLRWFTAEVGMSPVWLCPLQLRDGPAGGHREHAESAGTVRWPLYPIGSGVYMNVGFWGTVTPPAGATDGDVNRAIESAVTDHRGHKSLYSDAYYDPAAFHALYGGPAYDELKRLYDPDNRLTGMYEKAVGRR